MLTLIDVQHGNPDVPVSLTLPLTAEERRRSRHRWNMEDGNVVFLRLPRGTVLREGDILQDEGKNNFVRVVAKPEPVLTVIASQPLLLMRAAYHLGNRHVLVEITPDYLRLAPDSVLADMLAKLGLEVIADVAPFQPELGAYGYHSH